MLLKVCNRIEEIERICSELEKFCNANNICEGKSYDIVVIVDEMATNIINYAYPPESEHQFDIDIEIEGDYVHIQLIDDGVPFDPLKRSNPNFVEDINKREKGGLGIYWVKQLSDFVTYSRISGKNHLDILVNTTE